ncbi:proton-associated sugar transporter A [Lucilia sericata]|uniref:proton-associated sugar transporter A n=1 Tax=Lucilia sericata TaxID=13632 RepID=UPI0018A818CE|nr:proton-associated sugar transporter A [Lucilia sericata]XP_037828374.1 proton-associated sugar transporter A [Lucilia sericata]
MEKLHEYQGFTGRLHQWRDNIKESVSNFRDQNPNNIVELAKTTATDQLKGNASADQDYSHIYRHKSRMELVRVSAAVMGIEFSYAAETAFVSPTLLKIGVEHQHMTLVWALSPLVGFFLTPILGSMSDRCKLNMGRRRPFIILLSIGVFLGLLLVPNGEDLGYLFGDIDPHIQISAMNLTLNGTTHNNINVSPHRATASKTELGTIQKTSHPWGIFFTVLGTVLLDFDADACQSPSRAYLLDVCVPDDHAKGLSTFTIMAGLGGFMGYSMGGINWDDTSLGRRLGGHVKAVFTIITFIFIACVTFTVTSFKEIPLWALAPSKTSKSARTETDHLQDGAINYGTLENTEYNASELNENPFDKLTSNDVQQQSDYFKSNADENEIGETSFMATDGIQQQQEIYPNINENENVAAEQPVENLSHYLLSIVYMPHSLRMVCLTNLFCWMAHVCYSLYFTDFVGEAVFNGDPKALEGSQAQILYEEGVRFGCWGMAMYSLSCACYSFVIEKLIQRFKAKNVYVGGLLFYCTGMCLMALTRAKASVIIFSWAAGVMYSTLFTMPYLLVAHYHSMGTFELDVDGTAKLGSSVRGLGTDVAIVSSMVFLAQFILSICMGTIVSVSGTTTAVVSTASFLSFCGAISATQIMYLDL